MKIDIKRPPIAGSPFEFTVMNAPPGGAEIEVFVDTLSIFNGDCPDPPCHEIVQIPKGTRGSLLRIIVKDSLGNEIEQEMKIGEAYSSPGSAVAAA